MRALKICSCKFDRGFRNPSYICYTCTPKCFTIAILAQDKRPVSWRVCVSVCVRTCACVAIKQHHYARGNFSKQNDAVRLNVPRSFIYETRLDNTAHYQEAMTAAVTVLCSLQVVQWKCCSLFFLFCLSKVRQVKNGWQSNGSGTVEQHLIGLLQPRLAWRHRGTCMPREKKKKCPS